MDEFDRTYSHAGGNGSASGNEKLSTFSPANVPHNLRPSSLNAPKDMYWFAHTGESSQGNGSEGEGSPVRHANGEDPVAQNFSSASLATDVAAGGFSSDSTKTTPMGRGALSPGHSESKDETLTPAQRDHEQRLRHYKELQEEDRLRKLSELQSASHQAQRFREQQEEDRRRKIDELRNKDLERRQAVEERKRLIWEAEQERKEAILRRNLERDAKIEAKRNAHRNTMSVAFGSSTPREIDLPLASGMTSSRGSAYGSMMALSSVCHPAELFKKRTPSADVLDKKSDLFPSSYENSTPPGVQMQTRDSEFLSSQYPRRSFSGMGSEATRACLTIPETPPSHTHTSSSLQAPTDSHDSISDVWLFGSGVSDPMTRSLVILPSNRGRRKTDLTPTIPWERDLSLRSQSPGNIAGGRSQAMRAVSMSRLDILAQPRRRPSAHLDQTTQGVPSTAAVNSSKGLHKDLHSPNRPRSSQSMASEQSVASTVSMRSHSGPRRARPFSIAGSVIPINPEAGQVHHPLPPQRRSRTAERKVPVVPPTRPPRAKSVGPDGQVAGSTPKAAARKPPVAPKNGVTTANLNTEPTPPVTIIEAGGVPSDQTISPERESQEPTSTEPKEDVLETVPLPNSESPQPSSTAVALKTEELKESVMTTSGKTPRITSEEEAKAALAEKRRLAREQAEREAELERQRQEELRRQEEERLRAEEEEQKRMEEEQLRLAEELRKQEEEKLQKAIQEQQKREEEEKTRKEEENRLRLEKEEQDRKLREEAERQRKELEEKLKQEETARAERKKRVEQIMKRTRTKNEGAQRADELERPSNSVETDESNTDTHSNPPAPVVEMSENMSEPVNKSDVHSLEDNTFSENTVSENSEDVERMNGLNKIVDSEVKVTEPTELPATQNRFQGDFVDSSDGVVEKSNGTLNPEEVFAQTNGFSSHDVSLSEISPEEKTQQDLFTLLDFTPEGGSADSQRNQSPPPPPLEFDQLIDLSLGMTNQNEVNRLNNADELNSNRVPSIPFIAFEENVTRKQESTITDLLS